jgi:hypothetical protein
LILVDSVESSGSNASCMDNYSNKELNRGLNLLANHKQQLHFFEDTISINIILLVMFFSILRITELEEKEKLWGWIIKF